MDVCILPIGDVDADVISFLKNKLKNVFGCCKVLIPMEIPMDAYDPQRKQFNSTAILLKIKPLCRVVLGVIDVDIYADRLNFVFGEAEVGGNRAIISLTRLRQEFYGLPADENLFKLRALKEAMHEIGHVFGLLHCSDRRCVMHFSNSIVDTDIKDWRYCERCKRRLEIKGIKLNL